MEGKRCGRLFINLFCHDHFLSIRGYVGRNWINILKYVSLVYENKKEEKTVKIRLKKNDHKISICPHLPLRASVHICPSVCKMVTHHNLLLPSLPAPTPRVSHLPAARWPTACCPPARSTTPPPPPAAAATSRRGSRPRRTWWRPSRSWSSAYRASARPRVTSALWTHSNTLSSVSNKSEVRGRLCLHLSGITLQALVLVFCSMWLYLHIYVNTHTLTVLCLTFPANKEYYHQWSVEECHGCSLDLSAFTIEELDNITSEYTLKNTVSLYS